MGISLEHSRVRRFRQDGDVAVGPLGFQIGEERGGQNHISQTGKPDDENLFPHGLLIRPTKLITQQRRHPRESGDPVLKPYIRNFWIRDPPAGEAG